MYKVLAMTEKPHCGIIAAKLPSKGAAFSDFCINEFILAA